MQPYDSISLGIIEFLYNKCNKDGKYCYVCDGDKKIVNEENDD